MPVNSATDSSVSRLAIAQAIAIQLQGLTLNVPDPNNPGYNLPAFQNVQKFDIESLTDAFRYLIMSEQRVCVILFLDQQFTQKLSQGNLFITRMQPVALIISDRRLGDRVKALWGDPDDNTVPGAFALEEVVRPAVTGQLITGSQGLSNVVSAPAHVTSLFLKDDDRQELPGRAAVMLELHITGGVLQATLGPGPNL